MDFKLTILPATVLSLSALLATCLVAPHLGLMAQPNPPEAASQELIRQIEEAGGISVPDPTPPAESFQVIPPGTTIRGRRGLVGKILDLPNNLKQEIAIAVPIGEESVLPDDSIGWQMISSVRYRGDGNTIIVTVVKPTPLAIKYTRRLASRLERLDDGSDAEFTEDCSRLPAGREPVSCAAPGSETPNSLVFNRGQLIISIASNLSIDEIKGFVKKLRDSN